jgi:hypothetical protein
MESILSSAYWPNLHYFYYFLNSERAVIEQFENYQKQSYRNRTVILSANGPLNLSIPIQKNGIKELTKDIEISYAEAWQTKHWRAITSAYKNSPYFEHFESEIESFYTQRYSHLLDYNSLQLKTILKILKIKKEIGFSKEYVTDTNNVLDLREKIHPKLDFRMDLKTLPILSNAYYQTFETKFEFAPNLSILDLLFNIGLETVDYLRPIN